MAGQETPTAKEVSRSALATTLRWSGITLVILLAGVMSASFIMCHILTSVDTEGRGQLVRLREALHSGLAPEEVRRMVATPEYSHLRIFSDGPYGGGHSLVLATGVQCDAKNWLLWLEYEGKQLKRARVGTVDSWYEHPEDAPPDKSF